MQLEDLKAQYDKLQIKNGGYNERRNYFCNT